MKKGMIMIALCGFILVNFTACGNTVEGMGRDMERTGQRIKNAF
jgi:predicted small secreted protein